MPGRCWTASRWPRSASNGSNGANRERDMGAVRNHRRFLPRRSRRHGAQHPAPGQGCLDWRAAPVGCSEAGDGLHSGNAVGSEAATGGGAMKLPCGCELDGTSLRPLVRCPSARPADWQGWLDHVRKWAPPDFAELMEQRFNEELGEPVAAEQMTLPKTAE